MSYLILSLFLIFCFIFSKQYFGQCTRFIISLSIIDGIAYIFMTIFAIVCCIMLFQPVNLPFFYHYPSFFKFCIALPCFGLVTVPIVIDVIRNPKQDFRFDMIEQEQREIEAKSEIKNAKKMVKSIKKFQHEYIGIRQYFEQETERLKSLNLSDEEMKKEMEKLVEECQKRTKEIDSK